MKFFKNYIYNVSYQILAMILPIITVPYIVSHLTQTQIGINSFVMSNASYFTIFGMLGLKVFGTREISKIREDKDKLIKTFSSLYSIQAFSHIISIIVYIFIFVVINSTNRDVYLLYLVMLFSSLLDISWFYQGLENFKLIANRNLAIKLMSVLCLFLLVKNPNDFYTYILILYIPELLVNIIMWFQLNKIIPIRKFKISYNKLLLIGSITLFFPQIASSVYTILDKTMVGIFSTMTDLALYDQSQKIVRIALTIVSAFSTVMMPKIALMISKNDHTGICECMKKSAYFMWYIAFGLSFGIMGIASLFVPWFFGSEYLGVIPLLKYSAWIIIPVAGANLVSVQYLIPIGKQNLYTITLIIASISNLILNTTLIPIMGSIGATIASVVAELIGFILQVIVVKKYLKLSIIFSEIYKVVLCGFLMFVMIEFIALHLNPSIINTIITVVIGFTFYSILILFFNYGDLRKKSSMILKKIFLRIKEEKK